MSIVCCFGCLALSGCRNRVIRHLTYFPPMTPGYCVERQNGEEIFYLVDGELRVDMRTALPPNSRVKLRPVWLETPRRQRIPAFLFLHGAKPIDSTFLIIFSHGNSTDIGFMASNLYYMSNALEANILSYEYSGYGLSSGKPSESNTFADIRAAHKYAVNVLGVSPHRIVAYGQSVGSGPTCDLGADSNYPLAGVVLHSGIASGLRILNPDLKKGPWFDLYRNVEKLRQIKCPVYLIHGTDDREVPLCHGEMLYDAGKSVAWRPWWVESGEHNDIEIRFRKEYFSRLRDFLYFCEFKRNRSSESGGNSRRSKLDRVKEDRGTPDAPPRPSSDHAPPSSSGSIGRAETVGGSRRQSGDAGDEGPFLSIEKELSA